MRRNILVVGGGNLGRLLTFDIASHGRADVVLASSRHPPDFSSPSSSPKSITIRVGEPDSAIVREVTVPRLVTRGARFDCALLAVKSYDLASATAQLFDVYDVECNRVVCLSNGLNGEKEARRGLESVVRRTGVERSGVKILRGTSYLAARTSEDDDRVTLRTGSKSALTYVEKVDDELDFLPTSVHPSLVASPEIESVVWTKLLANVVLNPVTALMRVRTGIFMERIPSRLVDGIIEEFMAVADRKRIKLNLKGTTPRQHVESVGRATAQNVSSMALDVMHNRRTEIEAITGALVAEGNRLGIPMPHNETIYDLLAHTASGS